MTKKTLKEEIILWEDKFAYLEEEIKTCERDLESAQSRHFYAKKKLKAQNKI